MAPASGDANPMDATPNPFPGLRPFESADRRFFFGRDLQIQELVQRLASHRVVAIIGGSGCGKSSLVRAGLLPALTGLGLGTAGRVWQPVVFVPGRFSDRSDRRSPLYSLARAFNAVLEDDADAQARTDEIVRQFDGVSGFGRLVDAYADRRRVRPGLEGLREKTNYLFVVDQFEELFSEKLRDQPEPVSMISRIVENWRKPHPRAFIVLTMRSEHLESCTAYGDFPEVINATSYLVRRLRDSELQQAIVRPIEQLCTELASDGERSGISLRVPETLPVVDADVVRDLLKSVDALAHDPDHLPLFQHCLFWLWRCAVKGDGGVPAIPPRFTVEHLARAVGTSIREPGRDRWSTLLADCLDHRANLAFAALPTDRQQAARQLLNALGVKDHEQRYKRTPLRLERLAEIGLDRGMYAQIRDGINAKHPYLRDTTNDEADICHEALIRKWRKLRGWVDEEYDRADLYHRIAVRLGKWRNLGCPRDDKDEWLYEKVANSARDSGLLDPIPPLWLERLYPWDEDPLGIRSTPERLAEVHAANRTFIEESLAYHDGLRERDRKRERQLRFRRGGMIVTASIGGVVLCAWLINYFMGERELRALYSTFIANSNSRSASPSDTPSRRLAHLWQGMVAHNVYSARDDGFAAFLANFSVLIDPRGARRDRLASTRAFGEATLSESFKEILAAPMPQELPETLVPAGAAPRPIATTASREAAAVTKPHAGDAQPTAAPSGPQLVAIGPGEFECVDPTRPGIPLLKIAAEVVSLPDNVPLLSFPPNANFRIDSRCEAIVAAVPQPDNLWSVQLVYITWRRSREGWIAVRAESGRNLPFFERARSVVVTTVDGVVDSTVTVRLDVDEKPRLVRVFSLRPEPWPEWSARRFADAQRAVDSPEARRTCTGVDAPPVVGNDVLRWYLFDDPKGDTPLCLTVAPAQSTGIVADPVELDAAPPSAELPIEGARGTSITPQLIQFFAPHGARRESGAQHVPLAKVSFTGPPVTGIRLRRTGRHEGWIEIDADDGSNDAPDASQRTRYVAPARLGALNREACRAATNAPREYRNILVAPVAGPRDRGDLRSLFATKPQRDASKTSREPLGVWNLEYDELRRADSGLQAQHEAVGQLLAGAGTLDAAERERRNPCDVKRDQ